MNKFENKDSLYYVIFKGDFDAIVVAKIDPKTRCFYDYHRREDVENYDDFQIGQSVREGEYKKFEIVDSNINEEVVKIVEQDAAFYEALKEKYKDKPDFGFSNFPPPAKTILYDLIKQRLQNNKSVNLYVLAILHMLSDGMGLRVCWQHGGTLYDQISLFTYPEELYEVLSAMYDIISEKLEKNESMNFILYEYGGINEEYKSFIDEIERRTRYSSGYFGSDLKDQIRSEAYHGDNFGFSERRKQLSIMKPRITISPTSATYYHDMASDNALVETTSPKQAEKNFGWVIGMKSGNVPTKSHDKLPPFRVKKDRIKDTVTLAQEESRGVGEILHCTVRQIWDLGISVSVDGEMGYRSICYSGIDYSKFKPGQRIVIVKNGYNVKIYDEMLFESNGIAHEEKTKNQSK